MPTVVPAMNEAPIARPSVKLCAKSATRLRYAATWNVRISGATFSV